MRMPRLFTIDNIIPEVKEKLKNEEAYEITNLVLRRDSSMHGESEGTEVTVLIPNLLKNWGKVKHSEKSIDKLSIQRVIYNKPATIVFWKDGTKTVVKCGKDDTYDKEKGLAMCMCKKMLGNKGSFNEAFKKWL